MKIKVVITCHLSLNWTWYLICLLNNIYMFYSFFLPLNQKINVKANNWLLHKLIKLIKLIVYMLCNFKKSHIIKNKQQLYNAQTSFCKAIFDIATHRSPKIVFQANCELQKPYNYNGSYKWNTENVEVTLEKFFIP